MYTAVQGSPGTCPRGALLHLECVATMAEAQTCPEAQETPSTSSTSAVPSGHKSEGGILGNSSLHRSPIALL